MTSVIPQQFEAADAGEVLAGFGRALAEEPLEQPLSETAKVFRAGVWGNFMRAAGPEGSQWPSRVDNLPHPLLILTAAMIRAATDESAPGAITFVAPRAAAMGIDDASIPYAKFHMTGTKKMPARPYYYAGSTVLDSMADKMASETMRLLVP